MHRARRWALAVGGAHGRCRVAFAAPAAAHGSKPQSRSWHPVSTIRAASRSTAKGRVLVAVAGQRRRPAASA